MTMPETTRFAYWSSMFFLVIGAIFLFGYWLPFNINILSYISVSDIIKITIYPIVLSILGYAIGMFLGIATEHWVQKWKSPTSPQKTKIAGITVLEIITLTLTAIPTLLLPDPYHVFIIATIINYGFIKIAISSEWMRTLAQQRIERYIAIAIVLIMPLEALAIGYTFAKEVIHGRAYNYVVNELPGIPIQLSDNVENRPRIIGHVNDYIFLYLSQNKSVVIMKFNKDTMLEIKSYTKSFSFTDLLK